MKKIAMLMLMLATSLMAMEKETSVDSIERDLSLIEAVLFGPIEVKEKNELVFRNWLNQYKKHTVPLSEGQKIFKEYLSRGEYLASKNTIVQNSLVAIDAQEGPDKYYPLESLQQLRLHNFYAPAGALCRRYVSLDENAVLRDEQEALKNRIASKEAFLAGEVEKVQGFHASNACWVNNGAAHVYKQIGLNHEHMLDAKSRLTFNVRSRLSEKLEGPDVIDHTSLFEKPKPSPFVSSHARRNISFMEAILFGPLWLNGKKEIAFNDIENPYLVYCLGWQEANETLNSYITEGEVFRGYSYNNILCACETVSPASQESKNLTLENLQKFRIAAFFDSKYDEYVDFSFMPEILRFDKDKEKSNRNQIKEYRASLRTALQNNDVEAIQKIHEERSMWRKAPDNIRRLKYRPLLVEASCCIGIKPESCAVS